MLCQLSYRGTVLSGPKCSRDRGTIQVELDRIDRSIQTDARASPYVLRSAPQAALGKIGRGGADFFELLLKLFCALRIGGDELASELPLPQAQE
jgi:hypothetical protein